MDTVDRIFDLVDKQFSEQKEFAEALGLIPERISSWRRRATKSYTKHLPEIAAVLGTSVEYLLTGEKEKQPSANPQALPDFTEGEIGLIEAYRNADQRTRKMVDLALEPFQKKGRGAQVG